MGGVQHDDDDDVCEEGGIVRVRTHFGYGMAVASDGKSYDTGHIPSHVT